MSGVRGCGGGGGLGSFWCSNSGWLPLTLGWTKWAFVAKEVKIISSNQQPPQIFSGVCRLLCPFIQFSVRTSTITVFTDRLFIQSGRVHRILVLPHILGLSVTTAAWCLHRNFPSTYVWYNHNIKKTELISLYISYCVKVSSLNMDNPFELETHWAWII